MNSCIQKIIFYIVLFFMMMPHDLLSAITSLDELATILYQDVKIPLTVEQTKDVVKYLDDNKDKISASITNPDSKNLEPVSDQLIRRAKSVLTFYQDFIVNNVKNEVLKCELSVVLSIRFLDEKTLSVVLRNNFSVIEIMELIVWLNKFVSDVIFKLQLIKYKDFTKIKQTFRDIASLKIDTSAKSVINQELKDSELPTSLWMAIQDGYEPLVVKLISTGAKIDIKNKKGLSLIWYAFNNKKIDIVARLLDAGADIEDLNDKKQTMLFCAVEQGEFSKNITTMLLAKKANIDAKGSGITALCRAVQLHSEEPKLPQASITTPPTVTVAMTVSHPHAKPDIIKMLLAAKADPNIPDVLGYYPLHYASAPIFNTPWNPKCPRPEVVKLLLDAGANVDAEGNAGRTPLESAIGIDNNKEVIQILLDNKANVDKKNKILGLAPLHYAAECSLEYVIMLVNTGADVNILDKKNYTPLHYAAGKGLSDIAEALLDAGASKTIKNNLVMTPAEYAAWYRELPPNKGDAAKRKKYDDFIKIVNTYVPKPPQSKALTPLIDALAGLRKKLAELKGVLG